MFIHLRGRSTYSMLEGIGSLASILSKAKELGQEAIAVTDLYGMYGVVDFYNKAKGYSIKPLIGVEIPWVPHLGAMAFMRGQKYTPTITLLVRDHEGYHNLLRLVSAGYEHCHEDVPCIDSSILQSFSEGLFVLVGGLGSYVMNALVTNNDTQQALDHMSQIVQIMGKENTIIDITAQSYEHYRGLESVSGFLLQQAEEYQLTAVTSSGYLYGEASQKTAYETALAIKDGKKVYESDARKIVGEHHILSEQEVRKILSKNGLSDTVIEQLVNATGELADCCTTKITLGQALFPNFETPEEIRVLYEENRDSLVES